MRIHITSAGESADTIANLYGINEQILRQVNELGSSEPTEGEELLISLPTREYRVCQGDTAERIGLRFGIRTQEIYQSNPWIIDRPLKAGEILTLKSSPKKYGMSAANGYFYKGCDISKLRRALPYLTYVTFASAVTDGRNITKLFDDRREVNTVSLAGKIPLLRIYDKRDDRYKNIDGLSKLIERIIEVAKEYGYKGLVIDGCPYKNCAEEFSEFLVNLRKKMIGCDLILITEINKDSPVEFAEYSDGAVLYNPRFAGNEPTSFNDGERAVIADFACNGESAKAFIDLPAIATNGKDFLSVSDAISRARKNKCRIEHNESTLLSHFRDRKQGEYKYTSLTGIKAILDLVNEFGYMGVCFDIMRTPLSHLLMFNKLYKSCFYTNVRALEGCNREGED